MILGFLYIKKPINGDQWTVANAVIRIYVRKITYIRSAKVVPDITDSRSIKVTTVLVIPGQYMKHFSLDGTCNVAQIQGHSDFCFTAG